VKLADEVEDEIEALLRAPEVMPSP